MRPSYNMQNNILRKFSAVPHRTVLYREARVNTEYIRKALLRAGTLAVTRNPLE